MWEPEPYRTAVYYMVNAFCNCWLSENFFKKSMSLHFFDDDDCSDSGLKAPNSNSLHWTHHWWCHTWSKVVSWEEEHHWIVICFQHNILGFLSIFTIWRILKATSRLLNESINSVQNVLAQILCEYIEIGWFKENRVFYSGRLITSNCSKTDLLEGNNTNIYKEICVNYTITFRKLSRQTKPILAFFAIS